jgi:3-dehydroquinate dehydratase-1
MKFDEFVLAASTADLADESAVRDRADALEFRMDLASDPLSALSEYDGTLPVVATNRTEQEGGNAPLGGERIRTLRRALEHPAVAAVDVELAAIRSGPGREILEASDGAATIVSVHDFDETPSRQRMRELLEAACDHGTVGKLSVTATAAGDVLDVLSVTHELTLEGRTVATMAMGEVGRHSRAVAPLYGSWIGYAPADEGEATAPGQYDLATLSELIDALAGEEGLSGVEGFGPDAGSG